MGEQEGKRKYLKIIEQLQQPHKEQKGDQRIYQIFKSRIQDLFKLQVTCDSALQLAIHQYFKDCQKNFSASQSYSSKLKFIQRLNQLFRNIEFISKRQYFRMHNTLEQQIKSPANKWIEEFVYLKSSVDVTEFRSQFLSRYCGLSEVDVYELLENQSNDSLAVIKGHYQKFFTQSLRGGVSLKTINFIQDVFSQYENKSQMLSSKLILEIEKKLGTAEVGSSQNQILINQQLRNLAQENAYNNDQQVQQRLEDQIKLLEKAFRKFSGLNIFRQKKLQLRLGKFGSITSGFAGIDADLDLTILTNCYINQIQLLKLLHQFLRKQYKVDDNRGARRVSLDFIQQAKIPLIQVLINERGKKQMKIDIIVNNILGIINSKFLSVYSSVKWIKNLGLLVKMWGKAYNLIGKNYLSSYAIILMLIHYLIKAKKAKPILDNRVISAQKPYFQYKRLKQSEVEKFKVYYGFKNEAKDVSLLERANYYKILMGFTKYYGQQLWRESQVNQIITVDQSVETEVDKEAAITIKDPFDAPHNPGRIKLDSKDFLIQKFKDAHQILKNGEPSRIIELFTGR